MVSRRTMMSGMLALLAIASPIRAFAENLDEATVKASIQKVWSGSKVTFRGVQIASPRKASLGEIQAAGLPPDVTVTVVRAEYQLVIGDGGRDFRQQYLFYKDDFQQWAMVSDGSPYNYESTLYYVPPY